MKEDIEKILAENREVYQRKLPINHRADFESKLDKTLHVSTRNNSIVWIYAAAITLLVSLGYFSLKPNKIIETEGSDIVNTDDNVRTPHLKKIEQYYLTAINFELANLNIEDTNNEIIESYFHKIETLTKEYKVLGERLDSGEINEKIIDALIKNLQQRLQLLIELKNILNTSKPQKDEKNVL